MRLTILSLLSIFAAYMAATVPAAAQMHQSNLPPTPHPLFAVMTAAEEAQAAFEEAQTAFAAVQSTRAALAEAKAAYDAIIDQMVDDGPDAATADEGWPLMQAYVEATIAHDRAIEDYATERASYETAIVNLDRFTSDELAELRTEVDLLNGLDQEVAENSQRISDLELGLQNYATAVNPLLLLLCDRLDEALYDEVCASFTATAEQIAATLAADE